MGSGDGEGSSTDAEGLRPVPERLPNRVRVAPAALPARTNVHAAFDIDASGRPKRGPGRGAGEL